MTSAPTPAEDGTLTRERSPHSTIFLVVAVAIAAVLLYLSLRKVEWRQVGSAIAGCRLGLLAFGMGVSACSYFCRGVRWRVLLNTQANLPVWRVFWANSAGYLGNNVLPARAGELIRTAMVSSQSELSKTFVLTTALAERLMDAIVLVMAGTVILRVLPQKPDWLAHAATPLLVVAVVAAIFLISIPLFETLAERLARKLPFPERLRNRLEHAVEHIAAGVRAFHDPGNFSKFFALTVVIWGLDAYASIVLAHSLGMQMSMAVALLLIVGLAMGSSLPSTPGYIGIYQFVAVTVLVPFHFTQSQAIAYILVAQAGGLLVTGVLGSIGLLQYRRMKASGSA